MQESFRRAIRKMTGASVRLNARPDRSLMMATISQSMMVTWSIALFEHLDAQIISDVWPVMAYTMNQLFCVNCAL